MGLVNAQEVNNTTTRRRQLPASHPVGWAPTPRYRRAQAEAAATGTTLAPSGSVGELARVFNTMANRPSRIESVIALQLEVARLQAENERLRQAQQGGHQATTSENCAALDQEHAQLKAYIEILERENEKLSREKEEAEEEIMHLGQMFDSTSSSDGDE